MEEWHIEFIGQMISKVLKFILIPVVLLALSIPIVLPYFNSGYFPTHDGEWAVIRLVDMFRLLKDFQFPARLSGALNFGYGYPLFNFAYPAPYYLGTFFYFITHSFVLSIKIMFVLSVIFSAFFMYLASYELWKNRLAGVISSIVYLYLPYRMVDLYVRGSIGESISFVLFPLIFYLCLRLFTSPFSRIITFLLPMSVALLITTHNIMTVLFLPVLTAYIFIRILFERRWDVFQGFILSLILGIGLAGFFWIPAIFEKHNVLLSQLPIADRNLYFVNLNQLIIPSWGYAPPTENGGFSYQLGIGQLLTIIISLFLFGKAFIKSKFTQPPALQSAGILIMIYILCVLLLFSFTGIIWKSLPLLNEINYPWTLLSQLGFLTAILAGFVATQGKIFKIAAVAVGVICIIFTLPYTKPERYVNHGEEFYMTNEATTTSSDELMPLWVEQKPMSHFDEKVKVVKGNAQISNLQYNSRKLGFDFRADSDVTFQINTIYYPGWRAFVNYEEVKIDYNNPQGVMRIDAFRSRNKVTLDLSDTPLRAAANFISIGAMLIIGFILLRPALKFK